jgi:hypothetical protein
MTKKASANIWWIIIGAVMALVVLIVIIVIFTGRTSTLSDELGNCQSKGGVCVFLGVACPGGTLSANTFSCGETANCCIGAAKRFTGSGNCLNSVTDVDGNDWCA